MEYRLFSFLVVDDDKDAADALADVFRLAGHDCVVAYGGRSSLDEARRFHIDVVILDINMPGLDGYETASCFLSAQVAQTPILIALTALSSREAKVHAMQIGFDAFLVKPANPHRLMDLVGKLFAERRPDASQAGEAELVDLAGRDQRKERTDPLTVRRGLGLCYQPVLACMKHRAARRGAA